MADSYSQKGDYNQALSLYQKSLRAIKGIGTKTGFSTRYFNIGLSYLDLDQIDSAEHYITLSHLIETELNDAVGLYWSNYGLGRIELKKDNLVTSRKYFEKALVYAKQSGDRASEMECLQFIADGYSRQSNLQEAANNYIRSLNIAQEIGYINAIPNIYSTLGEIYKRRGRLQQSVNYYEKYIALKDSLNRKESSEKLLEFQAKFEDEKKQQRIALLEKDQEIQKDQKKILWGGIGASLTVLILALNLFRITKKNNNNLNKKNTTIEAINAEISSKNLEITDSINYAKKIQKAMLPSVEKFKEHFEDAFVYFNPKDIVSGDFYWGTKIGNTVLFSVADCTGHGVPGAFMSLIGSNILDKIVGEYSITSPELVLDKLSDEIFDRLRADKSMNVKDGMDLSLCAIDLKTLKLKIAGAYNTTYLIRNNELTEFKGDKLQIGNPNQIAGRKFNLNEVQLQKGDLLYLFSDGFPDQKGGKLGKKFFYPPFRELLSKISKLNMKNQQDTITSTMVSWMKEKEQQDDMLILGIKI
jgi:serine phosphatase RsbU (regulator of sigma subunit)